MKKINKISIVYSATRKTEKPFFELKKKIIESLILIFILSTNIKEIKSEKKKSQKQILILVLGGDGTMIGSIRNLHSLNIPFLGINSGTVGFLTDLSISKIDNLKDILKGSII